MLNALFTFCNIVVGVAGTVCMVIATAEFVREYRNERRREEENRQYWEEQRRQE